MKRTSEKLVLRETFEKLFWFAYKEMRSDRNMDSFLHIKQSMLICLGKNT